MSTVHINLGENSYDVIVEGGVFQRAEKELNLNRRVLIVSDSGVPTEYAQALAAKCKTPVIKVFPDGEDHKNLATMEMLFHAMLDNGFTRKDCVVAVGGGVVGDLAGFTASAYMRGIDFYNIPTTVLSSVDSSVGGKTAVNFGNVKNSIGAFWQPKKVLIDVDLLKTLPQRQISNGLSEALKMSMTFDKELFDLFKNGNPFENIEEIIYRSVQLKADVVEKDEKEAGLRKVLNFGHTIAHGVEILSEGALYHGECVAMGMICMCAPEVKAQLIPILEKLSLPIKTTFDDDKVCEAIGHDKKAAGATISTIYVPEIGKFEMRDLTVAQIRKLLPMIK